VYDEDARGLLYGVTTVRRSVSAIDSTSSPVTAVLRFFLVIALGLKYRPRLT
jgi:hypothetical protein